VIVAYERNEATNARLAKAGIEVLRSRVRSSAAAEVVATA